MGLKNTNFFDNSKYETPDLKIICCKGCSSHLCLSDLIISDQFSGSSGPAYLVDKLINIEYDKQLKETKMRTGVYEINKIRCHQCKFELGWYYKKAHSYSETYKEGKYVIENEYILFIANNSSTNMLVEQARKNKIKRRYSSTSTISNESIEHTMERGIDTFKFSSHSHQFKSPKHIDYRDISNGLFLNRLRIPVYDKDLNEDDEDHDEDHDVFVDA